jgi:hypothetical protein
MGCLENMKANRQPADLVEAELLNHCVVHRTSFLCASRFEEDRVLRVHRSGAGWYLGVVEDTGEPVSRDSQYFFNQAAAEAALKERTWIQRMDP